jgi:hypothetical protein
MLTEAEFRALFDLVRARSPLGPDDGRGALNKITQSSVLAAMREVRLGKSVSLAAAAEHHVTTDNLNPTGSWLR